MTLGNPDWVKGKSGNPAGRPPMAMHLIFSREMAKHGYDVGEVFATALKEENWTLLKKLELFIPYCFVQLRAKEFDIKPADPEASKSAVEQKMIETYEREKAGNVITGNLNA